MRSVLLRVALLIAIAIVHGLPWWQGDGVRPGSATEGRPHLAASVMGTGAGTAPRGREMVLPGLSCAGVACLVFVPPPAIGGHDGLPWRDASGWTDADTSALPPRAPPRA